MVKLINNDNNYVQYTFILVILSLRVRRLGCLQNATRNLWQICFPFNVLTS